MNRRTPACVKCSRPHRGIFSRNCPVNAFCRPAQWPVGLVLALTIGVTPGLAASGPPPDYILTDNADLAFTSPDGATGIEQYMKDGGDFEVKWQAWARRGEQ